MENKETETRNLTMRKETWSKLDEMAKKYNAISSQELVRQCVYAMIKGEPKTE